MDYLRKQELEIYEENLIIVSPNEMYWKNNDGNRGIRICGAIKENGRRCQAPAGTKTEHRGVGNCLVHDKRRGASASWFKMSAEMAKGTKLGDMLERAGEQEVRIGETYDEIRFQQVLLLHYIDFVINRDKVPEFSKTDITFLKELNKDMIKSKESAARIKGSLKLDKVTVNQFVDQLLTFLFSALKNKLEKDILMQLIRDMSEKVFAPMTATSLIDGEVKMLAEVPASLENWKIKRERV